MAGRPLIRQNAHTAIKSLGNRVDVLERRIRGGGYYEIKVTGDAEVVTAGDGAFIFAVPGDLDGARLRYCNAFVTTASSSGLIEIMLRKNPIAVGADFDLLLSPITIDQGELDGENAVAWPIIDLGFTQNPYPDRNNVVYYRDQICIDVDDAGTGALGLGVQLGIS